MDEVQSVSITLSLEELLVVLNTLESGAIPGLDAAAWPGLPAEQQDVALSVAGRALEARGLAEIDQYGQMLVHRSLLTAVGLCAYPHRTLVIEHWAPEGDVKRLFAHSRDAESVVHTVGGGLHTFVLLPSDAALVDHLAAACEWRNAAAPQSMELTMPRDVFTRICDASATGADAEALQILSEANKTGAAGSTLVRVLAARPRVSIVEMLWPDLGQGPRQQSLTVIDGDTSSWLLAPLTSAAEAPLKARTVSRGELSNVLLRGL